MGWEQLPIDFWAGWKGKRCRLCGLPVQRAYGPDGHPQLFAPYPGPSGVSLKSIGGQLFAIYPPPAAPTPELQRRPDRRAVRHRKHVCPPKPPTDRRAAIDALLRTGLGSYVVAKRLGEAASSCYAAYCKLLAAGVLHRDPNKRCGKSRHKQQKTKLRRVHQLPLFS